MIGSITIGEYTLNKLKNDKSKRKGVRKLNGNMLLVYSVLKYNGNSLFREEILKEINNVFSERKLGTVLKELVEFGYIEEKFVNRKKYYKIIEEKTKDSKVPLSYEITQECIKGSITTNEYSLYCYMKYLEYNKIRMNRFYKGNALEITQDDLARELKISRNRISQMITNLKANKMLSISKIKVDNKNIIEKNIYSFNL